MNEHRVSIVQDLKDLSVRLVGPGAIPRIAEINESDDLQCVASYYRGIFGMSQRDALRLSWRMAKLETEPV